MSTEMIAMHVPEDKEILANLGEISLRHEHLYHILKMTIKSLTDLTVAEVMDATDYESASSIRGRVKKFSRKKLKDNEAGLKLKATLTQISRLTQRRNELMHGLWACGDSSGEAIMSSSGEASPLPAASDLRGLSNEMEKLAFELNDARLNGWLRDAINEANV